MATSAHKSTPKGDTTASDLTTTPSATSFAIPMRPGRATPATAQVRNTPELLDLILSNLRPKDILFRAKFVCRGFRNTVNTSPSIERVLAMTKLHAPSLHATPRTRYSQTIAADRNHPGGRLLYLDFEPLGVQQLVSSKSLRDLDLPEADMKLMIWWLKAPGHEFLLWRKLLPADLDASIVTIAELLESILVRERVRMIALGYEVVTLDIWYE
jgi:hypothetical protein